MPRGRPGRPSTYTPEIADAICARISTGESMRRICESPGMPGRQTVLGWLERHEEFRTKCARARDLQADVLLDKQLDVAQDVLAGETDPHAGKVAISAYQWIAAKLAPKRYGDRLELAGDKDAPLQIVVRDLADER